LTEARGKIAECFQAPFAQTRGLEYGDSDEDEDEGGISLQTEGSEARNIILVGHDINSDLTYLRRLNFNPLTQVPNILGTIDSATLYSAWRRDPQPTKLEKVLRDFDIRGYNLHNAGNDAVYTIQAMLAVCVRESMIRGGVEIGAAVPVEEEEEDDEDFVI
jgi:DNA polymerase III alpha subunit (gram-positive type)